MKPPATPPAPPPPPQKRAQAAQSASQGPSVPSLPPLASTFFDGRYITVEVTNPTGRTEPDTLYRVRGIAEAGSSDDGRVLLRNRTQLEPLNAAARKMIGVREPK